jgi:hypothetical protein
MAWISDIIKDGVAGGLKPVLMPSKRSVMLFQCPHCKALKAMVKFRQPGTNAQRQVCSKCNSIHHSPKFDNTAFRTGSK